jgi:hypothetical protein
MQWQFYKQLIWATGWSNLFIDSVAFIQHQDTIVFEVYLFVSIAILIHQ